MTLNIHGLETVAMCNFVDDTFDYGRWSENTKETPLLIWTGFNVAEQQCVHVFYGNRTAHPCLRRGGER